MFFLTSEWISINSAEFRLHFHKLSVAYGKNLNMFAFVESSFVLMSICQMWHNKSETIDYWWITENKPFKHSPHQSNTSFKTFYILYAGIHCACIQCIDLPIYPLQWKQISRISHQMKHSSATPTESVEETWR